MTSRPSRTTLCCAAALLAIAAGRAAAQASPYYVGASIAVSHDSNIARVSDADVASLLAAARLQSKSDTITVASLLAGIDQPFGRQRLNANVAIRDQRFADNKGYDNVGYEGQIRLDWSTVERVSGSLYLRGERSRFIDSRSILVPTGTPGQFISLPITDRIIARDTEGGLIARVGVVTRWTGEAALVHRTQSYHSDTFNVSDRDTRLTTLTPRLLYAPSPDLQLGVGARLGNGSYPNVAGGDFDRRDLDLSVTWRPSGASTFEARLGIGKQDYETNSIGDFSGVSGTLRWAWTPTGKLQLSAVVARDTGQYAADDVTVSGAAGGRVDGDVQTTNVGTSLAFSANWAATGKINVVARLTHVSRDLEELFVGPGTPAVTTAPGANRTTALTLGARWAPTRTVSLGCDLSLTDRKVSREGVGVNGARLTHPFSSNSLGCSAQALLQP